MQKYNGQGPHPGWQQHWQEVGRAAEARLATVPSPDTVEAAIFAFMLLIPC